MNHIYRANQVKDVKDMSEYNQKPPQDWQTNPQCWNCPHIKEDKSDIYSMLCEKFKFRMTPFDAENNYCPIHPKACIFTDQNVILKKKLEKIES